MHIDYLDRLHQCDEENARIAIDQMRAEEARTAIQAAVEATKRLGRDGGAVREAQSKVPDLLEELIETYKHQMDELLKEKNFLRQEMYDELPGFRLEENGFKK